MNELTQRMIETNGIQLHIAEQGAGPLVLLCHGFPESGIPGVTSSARWPPQAFTRLRPICAAMAGATAQRR